MGGEGMGGSVGGGAGGSEWEELGEGEAVDDSGFDAAVMPLPSFFFLITLDKVLEGP